MSSASMRLFRPDFRTIFKNLSDYERELNALTMDSIYENITRIVDDKALDETDTAFLVQKCIFGVDQPEKCLEVIMNAIWPPPPKYYYIVLDTAKVTDPVSTSHPKLEDLVEGVEANNRANEVKTVFQVIDSDSTITMHDNRLIIEKRGQAVPLLGQLCGQFSTHSGGSYHTKQNSTTENPSSAPVNADIVNNATQAPPSGGSSTPNSPDSNSDCGHSYWLQPPISGFSTPDDEAFSRHFQRPGMGHHRGFGSFLGRGAPRGTITSRRHGRGAPRGRGSAFTPNSASNYQFTRNISYYPMPNGRELKRTYAMTELSDPGAQTIVLGPSPDNTSSHSASAASGPTLSPSGNGEGSSNNGSPKKRTRGAEEDEEAIARPSTRIREDLGEDPPAVRPRYPSPTASDRHIGRIIAPFGTSIRFNPRSPEAER